MKKVMLCDEQTVDQDGGEMIQQLKQKFLTTNSRNMKPWISALTPGYLPCPPESSSPGPFVALDTDPVNQHPPTNQTTSTNGIHSPTITNSLSHSYVSFSEE